MRLNAELARKHLENRLAPLREKDALTRPPRGWIRAMRDALEMTSTQLAQRMGISQSRASALERSEVRDALTLGTLRQAAEALDCTLVYALVPNRPLDEMLRARARLHANKQLARTNHTMRLEDQALSPENLEAERARLTDALLKGDARRLWDEP
jgi:predicted DNA-binding mobile mystery protein A